MHKNIAILFLITALSAACSTEPNANDYYRSSTDSNLVASPTAVVYSSANITLFDKSQAQPASAQLIEIIQVDVYNEYGIMRQQAQINEILKEQACSLGGNIVIIIDHPEDKKHCYAKVMLLESSSANNAAKSAASAAINTNSAKTIKTPS